MGGQDTPFSVLSESRFEEQGRVFASSGKKRPKVKMVLQLSVAQKTLRSKLSKGVIVGLGQSPTQRERIHLSKQRFLTN